MGIWIVQQWSVQEADREGCEAALVVIGDHIRDEHPEIIGVRTHKQWVGSQPHRGFYWAEHSESLTAVEQGVSTPTCAEVWKPIHAMAMPGTHIRSVWLDAEPTWEQ